MQLRSILTIATVLSLAFGAVPVAAQSGTAAVQLAVVVPPRARAERLGMPVLRSVRDGLAEYSVTIVVRANAPYRISARPSGPAGGATLVRTADGRRVALRDGGDVVVAAGDRGVSTLELSHWVPSGGTATSGDAAPPAYTITLETMRWAP